MNGLLVKTILLASLSFHFASTRQEGEATAAVVSILVADLTEESGRATFEALSSVPKCNMVVLNNLKSDLVQQIPRGALPLDFGEDLANTNPTFDSIPNWLVSENRTVATVFANATLRSLRSYSLSQFNGIHFGNSDFNRPFFQKLEEKDSKQTFELVILNLDADRKEAINQLVGLANWVQSSENHPSIIVIKYQESGIRKFISKEMFEENCEVLSGLQSQSIKVLAANFDESTIVEIEPFEVADENNISEIFRIRVEFAKQ